MKPIENLRFLSILITHKTFLELTYFFVSGRGDAITWIIWSLPTPSIPPQSADTNSIFLDPNLAWELPSRA